MQLSFIPKLYEYETKDKNFVTNIIRQINNLRFFRVNLESRIGNVKEKSKEFERLCYINNKVGYCLYWLATLGYIHSRELPTYSEMSKDDWYAKTLNKGYAMALAERSTAELYKYSSAIESFSKAFKFAYINNIEKNNTSEKTYRFFEESLSEMQKEFRYL